jgi:hypothetical protein
LKNGAKHYENKSAFEKELEPLDKSLFETTQVTLEQFGVTGQQIRDCLIEDREYVDRFVRWHLPKLAIHKA